jgi:hypothetical protein
VTEDAFSEARKIEAGATGRVPSGGVTQFRNNSGVPARLIIVDIKDARQKLDISTETMSRGLYDASDSNERLIIALAPLLLRDVWNTTDESEWQPSKPLIIRMSAGDVRWIRAGIHHFDNLGPAPARFVLIEW